jgi:hypothetical protein
MPERGLFTTVVRAGDVRVSDRVEVTCRVDRGRPQAVVLLVSAGQPAGQGHARAVGRLLTRGLGAYVYEITPVPADPPAIRQALRLYSDGHSIDLVVAVGSSGVASSALQQAVESVAGAATPTADPAAGLDDWARAGGVVGVRQASLLLAIAAEPPAAAAALATALPGVRALLGQVCPRLSP